LKRYEEAEKIYLEIEKEFPGRYSTASNLGTLYELIGENQKALTWISKSVSIDPQSHFGSEWLHVNILKAKIKGEDAYTIEFLLGTDFGDNVIPSTNLTEKELANMQYSLYYQLNERMSFIEPPDKIVSLLLAALGDVCWLTNRQVPAAKNYSKALEYDGRNQLLASKLRRSQEKQIMIPLGTVKDSRDYASLYFVIGICFFAIAVISVRKWREER
jgi:tetratricopeptide (TPR) repeat protein